jgi:hypothetical protein
MSTEPPTIPSEPTMPISTCEPSASVATIETIPAVGK